MTETRGTPYRPVGTTGGDGPSADQSLAEIVGSLGEDTTRLLRQEVALAKAEVRQEMGVAGRGVAKLAVAGAAGLLALILLSFALARGLSEWMDIGWAYALVGVLWAVVAGVLASSGRATLAQVNPVPERTAETIRETPQVMRGR